MDKTISLQVLQQYFAGSLKDAAKSLGVCPTTLKRICRQHGITRWPSRKIKKVSHSLRKLQLVIDSVQGSEGSIQLASFYTNFPELRSPSVSGTSPFSTTSNIGGDPLEQLQAQPEASLLSSGTTCSKSGSSSCSHSSGSCSQFSCGEKQSFLTTKASGSLDDLLAEQPPTGLLKRVQSDAELHDFVREERKLVANFNGDHPPFGALPPATTLQKSSSSQILGDATSTFFRVKATFGEEKIRFSMKNDDGGGGGFGELQRQVARRFNITKEEDISRIYLKYLDDDAEWVLLTCDADLEECINILRSSRSQTTIVLSLHLSLPPEHPTSYPNSI